MEEKIYKTMGSTGAASLAVGICVLTGRHCSRNSSHCEWRALIEEPREDNILIFLFICRHHSRMMRSQTCSISFSVVAYDQKPYFSFFHFRQQEVPDLALGDGI